MDILEKLLERGATVDFQDRVSRRPDIRWEADGTSRISQLPFLVHFWHKNLPQGQIPPLMCCRVIDGPHLFSCFPHKSGLD